MHFFNLTLASLTLTTTISDVDRHRFKCGISLILVGKILGILVQEGRTNYSDTAKCLPWQHL